MNNSISKQRQALRKFQVKGEAQGSEDALKEFVSHLNKGPPAASVTGVEHENVDTKDGETGFAVR